MNYTYSYTQFNYIVHLIYTFKKGGNFFLKKEAYEKAFAGWYYYSNFCKL